MKNQFLISTLLCACGAASAQSSVTLYGVIDETFSRGEGSVSSRTSLTSGGNTASRLGLRGVEDLGGGMSAGFNLEAGLSVDSGDGQPTSTNNQAGGTPSGGSQALTFGRRSTVSLMGAWGEVRVGRDFTAHYRNRLEVDPFANGGVGSIQPFAASIGGPVSTRASNMVGYFLPANLGGLYGQFQHYRGENPSDAAQGGTGSSARIGYVWRALNLSLAAARTGYPTTATTGDIVSRNLGVQYEVGAVKFMAGLYRDSVASLVPLAASGSSLGGIWSVGAGEVKVALSRYGSDAVNRPTTRKLSLGYVHNLSKRTALYGTYARLSNSGGATAALNGAVTSANGRSSGFDLGIRHAF